MVATEDWKNNNRDITVVSQPWLFNDTLTKVSAAGTIGFDVSGSTSYAISIVGVDSGSNPLKLDASDFSYTESTKKLTLSSSGLTNFQNASASLKEKQKYQYTITFKFTDNASGKEGKRDVNINLFKAKLITDTDIENMMKSIKCTDFLVSPSAGQIVFRDGVYHNGERDIVAVITFDFNDANAGYSYARNGFELTGKGDGYKSASSVKTYTASEKTHYITSAIKNTEQYEEWFDWSLYGIDCSVEVTPAEKLYYGEVPSKATFTLKFTNSLKSGYAFTNVPNYSLGEVMTNKGLKIILNADKKPSDTKGSEWK